MQADGLLWCWGENTSGELGQESTSAYSTVPLKVGTDTDWAEVATGLGFTCARKTTLAVWCWGANSLYQTGTTAASPQVIRTPVSGLSASAIFAQNRTSTVYALF